MRKKIKDTRPKEKKKDTRAWNPFVGCKFDCVYCEDSYKKLLQWNGRCLHCPKCVAYEPHTHPERLDRLPSDKVIFVVSNGDISFCDPAFVNKIQLPDQYPVNSPFPCVFH